jgi:hypothetical protein
MGGFEILVALEFNLQYKVGVVLPSVKLMTVFELARSVVPDGDA